jgi:hypothetical protein
MTTLPSPRMCRFVIFTRVRRREILRTSPKWSSTKLAPRFGWWHHAQLANEQQHSQKDHAGDREGDPVVGRCSIDPRRCRGDLPSRRYKACRACLSSAR